MPCIWQFSIIVRRLYMTSYAAQKQTWKQCSIELLCMDMRKNKEKAHGGVHCNLLQSWANQLQRSCSWKRCFCRLGPQPSAVHFFPFGCGNVAVRSHENITKLYKRTNYALNFYVNYLIFILAYRFLILKLSWINFFCLVTDRWSLRCWELE